MTVERPPTPTEDRLPAWRRAWLAYREIREAGGSDQEAHEAAVAAVLSILPTLSQKEASAEAVNAIAYATKYHSDWFWRGAQHVEALSTYRSGGARRISCDRRMRALQRGGAGRRRPGRERSVHRTSRVHAQRF